MLCLLLLHTAMACDDDAFYEACAFIPAPKKMHILHVVHVVVIDGLTNHTHCVCMWWCYVCNIRNHMVIKMCVTTLALLWNLGCVLLLFFLSTLFFFVLLPVIRIISRMTVCVWLSVCVMGTRWYDGVESGIYVKLTDVCRRAFCVLCGDCHCLFRNSCYQHQWFIIVLSILSSLASKNVWISMAQYIKQLQG